LLVGRHKQENPDIRSMSEPDYYQIFGLPPSASAEEIRAAHRELVKRYHPDIYWTSDDKARATEKLRTVNEAYAVLGNPRRRKQYDDDRAAAAAARSAAATAAQRTVHRPRVQQRPVRMGRATSSPRTRVPDWAVQLRQLYQDAKKAFTIRRLAGTALVLVLCVAAAYSLSRPPPITPAWVLWQQTEIEPAGVSSFGQAQGWEQVGSFAVRVACVESLKNRVKRDQNEGSQAIVDEVNASVAITVLVSRVDPQVKSTEAPNGPPKIVKRVRNYECRAVQVRRPDSWLRRKLRAAGLIS
jgi:hypothetical protein